MATHGLLSLSLHRRLLPGVSTIAAFSLWFLELKMKRGRSHSLSSFK